VLVVAREADSPYARPLLALDGHGSASCALNLTSRVVPPLRRATAVHVVDREAAPLLMRYDLPDPVEASRRAQREATRAALKHAIADAVGDALDIDLMLVEGRPWSQILEMAFAANADLLVLGPHEHSAAHRVLLGSTSDRVIQRAEIDVLVTKAAPASARNLGREAAWF
jgi:nucleotide-binding universal stress UspA family protein